MAELGPVANRGGASSGSMKGQASGVADEFKGAARDISQEARAAGTSLRDDAVGLGSTLKQGLNDQVERQKNGIADRLSSVAERAQATAADLRENEAWLGNLLGRGAGELQSVADEIRRNDVAGILGSVEVFARRQPALFMGATVALGFALTRFVTAGPTNADSFADTTRRWDEPDLRDEHMDVDRFARRDDLAANMGGRRDPAVGGSSF